MRNATLALRIPTAAVYPFRPPGTFIHVDGEFTVDRDRNVVSQSCTMQSVVRGLHAKATEYHEPIVIRNSRVIDAVNRLVSAIIKHWLPDDPRIVDVRISANLKPGDSPLERIAFLDLVDLTASKSYQQSGFSQTSPGDWTLAAAFQDFLRVVRLDVSRWISFYVGDEDFSVDVGCGYTGEDALASHVEVRAPGDDVDARRNADACLAVEENMKTVAAGVRRLADEFWTLPRCDAEFAFDVEVKPSGWSKPEGDETVIVVRSVCGCISPACPARSKGFRILVDTDSKRALSIADRYNDRTTVPPGEDVQRFVSEAAQFSRMLACIALKKT